MQLIPDDPIIRRLVETGYPNGREPQCPVCPVCGDYCDTLWCDRDGTVFGCDNCVKYKDAWEAEECFPEKEIQ